MLYLPLPLPLPLFPRDEVVVDDEAEEVEVEAYHSPLIPVQKGIYQEILMMENVKQKYFLQQKVLPFPWVRSKNLDLCQEIRLLLHMTFPQMNVFHKKLLLSSISL